MKRFARFAPALLCAALAGCSDLSTQVVCPDRATPAVVVNVVDPVSNTTVSREATGTWTNGTMRDSMVHVPSQTSGEIVLAAYGPPGVYEVRVSRPGHPDWVRGNIQVGQGLCGPAGPELVATHGAGE